MFQCLFFQLTEQLAVWFRQFAIEVVVVVPSLTMASIDGPRQWGPKRSPDSRSTQNTPVQIKKGRSQERETKEEDMPPQELDVALTASLTTDIERKIHDIVEDIRDLKDQMKASQHQLAYLLYQEADKQRSEAASKIMVKNWWQFNETEEHYGLLCDHRENMIKWAAKELGISNRDIDKFHLRGKSISPFTMVNVGNHYTKLRMMDWFNETFDKKGWQEWTNDKLSTLPNGNNKPEVNGMIKFEPCIAGFDRMQTEPLKAIMAVITKLAPDLKWKHSWKHLTLQDPQSNEYLAWLALDHLEGIAKIYVDQKYFTARLFEDEFRAAFGNIMSKKTVGNKGKGKKGGEGVLTPDDFLKAVGLGSEGKGSYFRISTLSLKTKVPFVFEVRSIDQSVFTTKYEEHLNRIAKRILQPDLIL